ncbi:MAG: hypothetical protein ACYCYK_03300 [Candidatus Dormibacteria bacterium]
MRTCPGWGHRQPPEGSSVTALLVVASAPKPVLPIAASLILGLVVLALLLYRQLQRRPVQASPVLPLVLLVIGFAELTSFARAHPLTPTETSLLTLSLAAFAIGLGALRAFTVRLFVDSSRLMRQGTWVTVLLWLVAVGLHLAVDALNGVGEATLLLYLGLTLGTQQVVVQWRARRMRAA